MLTNLVKADTVGSALFASPDNAHTLARMKTLNGLHARFGGIRCASAGPRVPAVANAA